MRRVTLICDRCRRDSAYTEGEWQRWDDRRYQGDGYDLCPDCNAALLDFLRGAA